MPSTPDQSRIDQLLQFTLLTAGREDEYTHRWLSPIHLVKYVYLADLMYASENEGKTYTGLNWIFHHYGPWEVECFKRIDPALEAIQADKRTLSSKYFEDDYDRWYARDDEQYEAVQKGLPIDIFGSLTTAIRRFGADTQSLLHYVYTTLPMLTAAPGEVLDFTKALEEAKEKAKEEQPASVLTARQLKKRNQLIKQIKEKYRSKLDAVKERHIRPQAPPEYTQPRYDNVYLQGLEDLDRIAGVEIEPGEYKAVFGDDVWKSKSRYDPDLS